MPKVTLEKNDDKIKLTIDDKVVFDGTETELNAAWIADADDSGNPIKVLADAIASMLGEAADHLGGEICQSEVLDT